MHERCIDATRIMCHSKRIVLLTGNSERTSNKFDKFILFSNIKAAFLLKSFLLFIHFETSYQGSPDIFLGHALHPFSLAHCQQGNASHKLSFRADSHSFLGTGRAEAFVLSWHVTQLRKAQPRVCPFSPTQFILGRLRLLFVDRSRFAIIHVPIEVQSLRGGGASAERRPLLYSALGESGQTDAIKTKLRHMHQEQVR